MRLPGEGPADPDLPVSGRIKARSQRANQRFHVNDTIASFILPGEMDGRLEEVAGKVAAVLDSLVIETEHDHNTKGTARRVAKMYPW